MKHALQKWTFAILGALTAVFLSGCEPTVTCGLGTRLDAASHTCVAIPTGDLNVVVGDFAIGDYAFTRVDVPERLSAGTPDQRKFTLQNTGKTPRPIVSIRYGVSPVTATVLEFNDALALADDEHPLPVTYLGSVIAEDLAAGEAREFSYDVTAPADLADGLYAFFFSVDEMPLERLDNGDLSLEVANPRAAQTTGFTLAQASLVAAPKSSCKPKA